MQRRASIPIILAITGTVTLWGSAFVGIRAALEDYSPFHLALLRFLVASVFLILFALSGKVRLPRRGDLPLIFISGFTGIGFYNMALNYGAMTISAGSTSFIISTAPIITALIAFFFLGERINWIGWVGMVVSFAGVNLIAFGEGGALEFETGALYVFAASISTSVYFVIQKPLLLRYSSFEVAAHAIWGGTLMMLPFGVGLGDAIMGAPVASTLTVVYLGIFPAALAYFFWAYVLSKYTASRSVSFLYLIPVVASLLAYLLLGEILSPLAAAGGCASLLGVILLNTLGRIKARPDDDTSAATVSI